MVDFFFLGFLFGVFFIYYLFWIPIGCLPALIPNLLLRVQVPGCAQREHGQCIGNYNEAINGLSSFAFLNPFKQETKRVRARS